MKEIEIKLKYSDEGNLRAKLKELDAMPAKSYEIIDSYYVKGGLTMKIAENFIRIRTKGGISELTFKGKRETNSDVWERIEINTNIDEPDKVKLILINIGFKLALKNRTLREYWNINGTELGIMKIIEPAQVDFVEIEGKTKEAVEETAELFRGVLEPIEDDHFKKLDEANGG